MQVHVPVAGRHAVPSGVLVVVGQNWPQWSVVHLDVDHPFARQRSDEFEIVGASLMVPDVDTETAVLASGSLHDSERIGGGGDVGGRDELEPDQEPMIASPVTERPERFCAIAGRPGVGTECVEAAAAELVGDAECRRFLVNCISGTGRCRVAPGTKGINLCQAQISLVKKPHQIIAGAAGLESLEVPDVDPDRSTTGPSRGIEPLNDVVMAAQGEVAEDEVITVEFTGPGRGSHMAPLSLKRSRSTAVGRLEGKVAVVTGGASGIGAATVDRFIEEGAVVVVADLQDRAGRAIVARHGASALFCRVDVTVEADLATAVDLAVSSFGHLDVMVNNAGVIGATGPIAETSEADYDETIGVLLKGVFLGTKHAARVMMAQGSGVIISTASTAGIVGGLGPHLYTAAKHAVIGLTKSVANELGPHGIRVNSVAPGSTVTPMVTRLHREEAEDEATVADRLASRCLLGRAGLPVDVANAVVYLASDEARYVTGHCLVVDAGQTTSGTETHRFHRGEHA